MTIGTSYGMYQPYNTCAAASDYANTAASANTGSSEAYARFSGTGALTPADSEAQKTNPAAFGAQKMDPTGTEAKTNAQKADPDEQKKAGRRSSPAECETCKTRKYQDGSDENVSFKSASHISPQAAGAAVRAHENEHVSNAYKKASQNNGEVLSATVSIHMAVCPECGRSYVSGGTTNTMIKYTNESNPYQKELKRTDATRLRGANLDLIA